jgi:hypothetical protein
MNTWLMRIASVMGLAVLLAIPSSIDAATGPGPYYAEPSWDQTLSCDTAANCPRFIVLTNFNSEAVLDRNTGLVWQRSPLQTLITWHGLIPDTPVFTPRCLNSTIAGQKSWRLPSVVELLSLLDPSVTSGPKLPPGHPFLNVQADVYWSATTYAENSSSAWDVNFASGLVSPSAKTGAHYFWCVRGAMKTDTY